MNPRDEDLPWELLVRYAAGECDAAEAAALSRRIESDPAVADALAEVLLQAVVVRDEAGAHPEGLSETVKPPAPPPGRLWPALAAGLVLLVCVLWLVYDHGEPSIITITRADGSVRWTGAGGEVRDSLAPGSSLAGGVLEAISDDSLLQAAFADGTSLTLLGNSVATVSHESQKTVRLSGGSLSVEVKPQPAGRPLLIHTPTALLEVLGTRFEVTSDSSTTRLTVNEGRVRLTRLVDGHVAEVPAHHETVAALDRRAMAVSPRRLPEVLWRSDLPSGPAGTEGVWLPAGGEKGARLGTEAVFLPKSGRGPVTIHRVAFNLPWKDRTRVEMSPGSRVRLRGHASAPAVIETMLACLYPSGGYAGNWFQEHAISSGTWEIELPVSGFRQWHAQGKNTPREPLELRNVVVYTIDRDVSLEIEAVEVINE